MSKKLATYYYVVLSAAVAWVVLADWTLLLQLDLRQWGGIAAFAALAILSERLAMESAGSGQVRSSVAFLPLLASALVFPPAAVVVTVAAMYVAVDLRRGKNLRVVIFNMAAATLSYGVAATVFHSLAGAQLPPVSPEDGLRLFVPFYAAVIPYSLSNVVLVSAYVSVRDNYPLKDIIAEATGRGGGNVLYDLLATPLALLVAYLYWRAGIPGLLSVVLPLLLVRHSYLNAHKLERTNRDLLKVLIKAIETRDPYTSGHSLRVSTLAKVIAEDMGVRGSALANVEHAALLHDIGKIEALYVEIISKEGTLTDEERDVIQTHATKGADLLETLTSMEQEVVVGVRHHHERYDGTGYPDRLEGKQIPLAARIIMICDSVDAMLSDRPYRNALPIAHVREELFRCSGSQFDPEIVHTILDSNTLERAEVLVDRAGARSPLRAVVG